MSRMEDRGKREKAFSMPSAKSIHPSPLYTTSSLYSHGSWAIACSVVFCTPIHVLVLDELASVRYTHWPRTEFTLPGSVSMLEILSVSEFGCTV